MHLRLLHMTRTFKSSSFQSSPSENSNGAFWSHKWIKRLIYWMAPRKALKSRRISEIIGTIWSSKASIFWLKSIRCSKRVQFTQKWSITQFKMNRASQMNVSLSSLMIIQSKKKKNSLSLTRLLKKEKYRASSCYSQFRNIKWSPSVLEMSLKWWRIPQFQKKKSLLMKMPQIYGSFQFRNMKWRPSVLEMSLKWWIIPQLQKKKSHQMKVPRT